MATVRHRLGVVLLLPEPLRTQVQGIQLGLGADPRVPPHVTVIPPVMVDDVDAATAVVRHAASAQPSALRLAIGPSATFLPINPVVYLKVGGDLDALHALHVACRQGPLDEPDAYDYTPHVTLIDGGDDAFLAAAQKATEQFAAGVLVRELTVLEFGDDRVWRPIADAAFGDVPITRTLGADAVTITVTKHETVGGGAIGRYRPLIVEAFIDDRSVGVARGRVAQGDVAWLDELVIVGEQRGTGVGGALARAFVDAARGHEVSEVRSARGATIAGFLVRMGFVPTEANEFALAL